MTVDSLKSKIQNVLLSIQLSVHKFVREEKTQTSEKDTIKNSDPKKLIRRRKVNKLSVFQSPTLQESKNLRGGLDRQKKPRLLNNLLGNRYMVSISLGRSTIATLTCNRVRRTAEREKTRPSKADMRVPAHTRAIGCFSSVVLD